MYTIDVPKIDQIDQLVSLNRKYLFDNLSEEERKNGFIRITYESEHFRILIEKKEIVCALNDNKKIVGYYLIGRETKNILLDYQIEKAAIFSKKFDEDFDKLGYGCQVCIEVEHRKKDLFLEMLKYLCGNVFLKYSYLLCSISHINMVSLKAHQKFGWKIFHTNTERNYLYYPTR